MEEGLNEGEGLWSPELRWFDSVWDYDAERISTSSSSDVKLKFVLKVNRLRNHEKRIKFSVVFVLSIHF